jgi:beta-N-acetylhexosaminidase
MDGRMAKTLIPRADVRRAIGHLIICGFEPPAVTAEVKELLREAMPLGVILFARNIESLEHVAELNRELKALRPGDPLLCTVDQEGGRVARMREPATVWPSMRKIGGLRDLALVRRVGGALAQELRALAFDVDWAPVVDVDTNPDNPVIGDRAFADDPKAVAACGAALIAGLQGGGVGACAKHFPGHGDTDKDSHLDLPYVEHDLRRLRAVEWPPFAAAVAAGVGAVMTAHVVVLPLDEKVPATLSGAVLGHLRGELGFGGVIVSDDIEMKAVADRFSPAEMAARGVQAGVDVFLACRRPEVVLELYRGLVRAVEDEVITHEQLLAAEKRALAWRDRFFAPARPWAQTRHLVGPAAHAGLVEELDLRLRRAVS